jgi:nucleotide-binding universal stress UspA family protein
MPIKSILVPLADAEGAQTTLAAAFAVAQSFDASVDVLHLRADPTESLGDFVGESVSPQLVEEVLAQAEKRSATIAGLTRKAYTDAVKKAKKVKSNYAEVKNRGDIAVENRGRLSDLIIVRRARSARDAGTRTVAEAALMGTARPVLVVPPKPGTKLGTSIAIAWNGSLEAAKAVGGSLPFLTRAAKVTVISANDGGGAIDQKGLLKYLERHGVKAKGVSVKAGADTGKAIAAAAGRAGADLLIMGAYTHSRVREMIFGGVTEHALSNSRMAVLLVH